MTTTSDDLTATVHSALSALDSVHKAQFLLDTALALIDAGKYGDDVERYLEVYLKTPNLPKASVAKALLARANARKAFGDRLLAQAHQDFQAVLRLDPSNRDVQAHIRRRTQIRFAHDPPSHRAPAEVWSRIATYIPRYHLRTWLSLSSFHRSIALHHIFHTIDLYFGEDQPENVNRSLDIFDRVKQDKDFARRVRCLRVHWAYEEGELLDLMVRVFRTALPEFCGLREFEWIGYPELRADMVQNLLASHPRLTSLGSIGFHFDACGISAFKTLKKLTLRAEDDDGYADWSEITTVLNNNASTLKHLILGAYLHRQHSWDATFLSPTIHNLTHLDLVDTRISHTVLSRIAHAAGGVGGRLESLTLHGILEEPGKAAVIFGSDEVINGEHTFLPRLKSFRFLLVGQPQVITPPPPATQPPPPPMQQPYYNPYPPHQPPPPNSQTPPQQPYPHPQEHYDPTILHLYQTITRFLRGRTKLRKLDLGSCPWDLVSPILPGLTGLRVLGVRIGCLARGCVTTSPGEGNIGGVDLGGCTSEMDVLVKSLPSEMGALRIEVGVSELPLHIYATQFQKFTSLSFLHLQLHTPQPAYHPPMPSAAPGVQQYQPHNIQLHPHPQYYPYHQGSAQQPQQPQQQPSYHPFPPHPASSHQQPAASGSGSGGGGGPQPGTPKRRNGPGSGTGTVGKKDGDHDAEGDEANTASSSGSGQGGEAGPSQTQGTTPRGPAPQASVQPSMPPPPPVFPQSTSNPHHLHQQSPLLSQPHTYQHGPVQPHQYLPPPLPPQPLNTLESAKHVAATVPSLDFVGWNGELYVIVRNSTSNTPKTTVPNLNASVSRVNKVDAGVEAMPGTSRASASACASPIMHTDGGPSASPTAAATTMPGNTGAGANATTTTPAPPTPAPAPTPASAPLAQPQAVTATATVELKELPSRRRLDCGKGVDLGSEDAAWLERKDVPMDYDMPVTGNETA